MSVGKEKVEGGTELEDMVAETENKDDKLKDMESEIFKKEKSTPPKWSCDNGYNH